jgi:glycosyltransferase involved in cell wall biosynthesis
VRVVLDLTPLVTDSNHRGIGRVVRGLAYGLSKLDPAEYSEIDFMGLVADREVKKLSLIDDFAGYCAGAVQATHPSSVDRRRRLITWSLRRMLPKDALFHFSEPRGMPLVEQYTLIAYDLISLLFPQFYLKLGHKPFVKALDRRRYGKAKGVLAISHATKHDVCEILDIEPTRVQVAWLGVDHARFRAEPLESDASRVGSLLDSDVPYVIYLGAGDARKDLDTLVTAFATSKARKEAHLVFAGPLGERRVRSVTNVARSHGVEQRVHLLGYVPEEAVPALYRRARVNAFVSLYEGFGLPVVEGLACGTPTITSTGSSLEEVAGDAALIVPGGDPSALGSALDRLFFDDTLRSTMRERGLARAREFTWESYARQTVSFLRARGQA